LFASVLYIRLCRKDTKLNAMLDSLWPTQLLAGYNL